MQAHLVRLALPEDCSGILEIYNHAVLNTTASYDTEPRSLEHRRQWFEDHAKANLPIYVAEDGGGRVIGWSALNRFHDRVGYRFTAENSVYVAHDARGRGVGGTLLRPLIQAARERQLHAILAVIDAQNEPSIRLHSRQGFFQVGLFRQVGFKFDRWLDVVYMEHLLAAT